MDLQGGFVLALACQLEPRTTDSAPGKELQVHVPFSVSIHLSIGLYTLKVGMPPGDLRAATRRLQIGTMEADADRHYTWAR